MSETSTREVVRAYHHAYCRGDVAAAAAQLGDPFRFSSPMMAFDTSQTARGGVDQVRPSSRGST